MQRLVLLTGMVVASLSACAPAPININPTSVGATQLAAANAILTRAAESATPKPTRESPPTPAATAIPFGDAPLTPVPVTGGQASPPAPTDSSATSGCNHPLDVASAGPTAPLTITNNTNGAITFTLGLSAANASGQCGYLSWANIAQGKNISVMVPESGAVCYWASAIVGGVKNPETISDSGFCINSQQPWGMSVNQSHIKMVSP